MRWYVLRSKPNREEALWLQVDSRGFQSFYPQMRVQPVNPRSRTSRPYFPGYLFVKAKLAEVGLSIFSWLPYSQGLVSFGGEPSAVPEELVHALRNRLEAVNAAGGPQRAALLGVRPGDTVLIESGPFAGYKAIFDARLAGDDRVRVLLKLLQSQQTKLELPIDQVQPIRLH